MSLSPPTALAERPALPLIVLLAGGYFLFGRLALLLAIPPGFASSVWPAAGIALMALLLAGRRLWPGVLMGSFLITFANTFEGLGAAELLRASAVAAAIGVGATLQAVLGAWAIGRWVGFPNNLSRSRDIFLFLAIGGPLSCLVSATVGIAALLASAVIVPVEIPFQWWTWWVGDSIGVLVIVPLALAFLGGSDGAWRDRQRRVGSADPDHRRGGRHAVCLRARTGAAPARSRAEPARHLSGAHLCHADGTLTRRADVDRGSVRGQ